MRELLLEEAYIAFRLYCAFRDKEPKKVGFWKFVQFNNIKII